MATENLPQRLRWIAEFMEDHGIGMGDECDAPTLIEAANRLESLERHLSLIANNAHKFREGLLRVAARCADWSYSDIWANIADALGVSVEELTAELRAEPE